MKNLHFTSLAFLTALLLGGCAQHDAKKAAPGGLVANTCVMSGEALDASSPTADFNGSKVGFCCDKCLAKWNKLDDAGKKAKLAEVAKK